MENTEKTFITDKNFKINCECGGCYTFQNKSKHFKSDKHQHYTKPNEDNIHKVYCVCGGKYTIPDVHHHNNTKRHSEYMNKNFPTYKPSNPNDPKQVEATRMLDKKYRKMKHREMEAINKQKKAEKIIIEKDDYTVELTINFIENECFEIK